MADSSNPFDPEVQKLLLGSNVNPKTEKRFTKTEVEEHIRQVEAGAVNSIARFNKERGYVVPATT